MGKSNDISKIFEVVLAFNNAMRYEELLNTILINMMEITSSDAGTLYILEDDMLHFRIIKNKTLGIFQSVDETNDLPPVVLDRENIQNVCAYTAIKNELVVIDDVYTSERFNFQGPRNYDKITGYRTRSMLTLPLSTFRNDAWDVLGVIQLLNATDEASGEFISYGNMDEQPVIPALANVAANTLSNLFHIQEIRKVFNSFVSAMVRTIDERSKYNSNHTHKVAALCDLFGKHLGKIYPEGHPFHFGERRLEELTMAAMLHDIGKIVTPIHIMDKADRLGERLPIVQNKFIMNELVLENNMLKEQISKEDYNAQKTRLDAAFALVGKVNALGFLPDDLAEQVLALADLAFVDKNGETVRLLDDGDIASLSVRKGTLTDAERLIMQEHANTTGRILSNIAFKKYYKNVTAWAQSHHEFLDGTGYPQGLAGDELATEVLIITIMDIFEALTAGDRPYKKAMPPERAFGILNEMAEEGKLHADLVRLFQDSGIWMQL